MSSTFIGPSVCTAGACDNRKHSTVNREPLLDTDGDGIPDAQELLAGTDPRDPRSVLRLNPRDKSATGLTLQFPTQPGKTYRIEYTDDLTRPWQILQDQIPGDVGTLSAVEGAPPSTSSTPPPPPAPTRPQRFYRLRVLP